MNCPECNTTLDIHGECPCCGWVDIDYQMSIMQMERSNQIYIENKPESFGLEGY